MTAEQLASDALEALRSGGITLAEGLTEDELFAAEAAVHCDFPPDLRLFLGQALPVGDHFPNWREPDGVALAEQLAHPIEGVLFDVRVNHFWMPHWPKRPTDFGASVEMATGLLATWPKLIPLYGHRYLPSEPSEPGNPVLSVMQTDITYYGSNLPDYFKNEFVSRGWPLKSECRKVPGWGYFVGDEEDPFDFGNFAAEFGDLSSRLHAAGWSSRVTVKRLIDGWRYLAATVGAYRMTIDEYTNDVTGRDALELVLGWATESTRAAIIERVAPADEAFRSATVDDGGLAIGEFFNFESKPGWWWRRRPTTGDLSEYLDRVL
jgi:hypothetical protein